MKTELTAGETSPPKHTTEAVKGASALMKNKVMGVCPNCGANVVEREKGWFCENHECRFVLWKDNAFFKRLGSGWILMRRTSCCGMAGCG